MPDRQPLGHADDPRPTRRLLIVDDNPEVCRVLADYFLTKHYAVREVQGGEEALALLDAFAPDVVLLDLLMPGMSGVELLTRLKHAHPAVKVIMLSAADSEDVAEGAMRLGADAYVCKPPNLKQLERLVSGFWPSRSS